MYYRQCITWYICPSMTNFIPVFPSAAVFFPGNSRQFTIYETQYRQLITHSKEAGKPFGVIFLNEDTITDTGCLVEIVSVDFAEDAVMQVLVKATAVFRVLELITELPDKAYGGAIVNYPYNNITPEPTLMNANLRALEQNAAALKQSMSVNNVEGTLLAYDVAPYIAFSTLQQQEFLSLLSEKQRQEYIRRYIAALAGGNGLFSDGSGLLSNNDISLN